MNQTTPQTTVVKSPSKSRRSLAAEAIVVRAKTTYTALPALLPGIAAKDKDAAKVRIDRPWVTQYGRVIAAAEQAEDGRSIATVDQKAATAAERQKGVELAALLTDVRGVVATHVPEDLLAQQAYGRGEQIDARRTGPLVKTAGAFLAAWEGKWKQTAVDAGVTQATMDQIQTLRGALSSADVQQRGTVTSNADGTVTRAAALTALRRMTAYAVKVVTNVYGRGSKQLASLADPRPLTGNAKARKEATKTKHAAVKAAKKAKKTALLAQPGKRAAAAKGRAKRAAIVTRAKAVAAIAKPAAKGAKAKRAVKKAKKTA